MPYDRFSAEASFTRGGWTGFAGDITSGQWDFNIPMGALKARFTGEIEGTESFVNFQDLERKNFALNLAYDNGGPVRGFLNFEYQKRDTLPNPGLPAIGTVESSGGLDRVSRDTFLGEPGFDRGTTESPLLQAWVEIDVLDNWNDIFKDWKVIPRYQYQEFNVYQNQMFLGAATPDMATGSINVARSGRTDFIEEDRFHIVQLDITGILETGPLSHQIYLGGEYQKHFADPLSQLSRVNVSGIDALNPTYSTTKPEFDPNRFFFGGGRGPDVDVDNTSFQIGGTFHLTDHMHVFAGYGEGFDVNDVGGVGADGSPLQPGESEQVEAGIKVNFPGGLTGTASFFEVTRTNVSTPDRDNPGFSIQTGEIRHRGAEVELAYQVTDQWYFQGGYVFINSDITKSNAGDKGNRFQNTPEHQASIWTHYRFDKGWLSGLALSSGVNFVGDRPLDNANTVDLPHFTTWDVGASYTFKNVKPLEHVKLELFANNLLDKRYFTANDFGPTVMPGDPRSVVGRISLKY
ncbi:MAG: TonB-dependent siderophore receptor [Methylohalobius sp. ZOD2]